MQLIIRHTETVVIRTTYAYANIQVEKENQSLLAQRELEVDVRYMMKL